MVTGAGGGLGSLLVDRLVREGYFVYATARSAGEIQCTAPGAKRLVVPVELDVTDKASIKMAVEQITAANTNGLAGLVNMASILIEGPLEVVSFDDFRCQFEVNVLGPFALTQALLPLLRAGRGRVVNIGAATAHTTVPFFGPVSASKAALSSVTDAMRMEFAPFGIKVVLVEPGAIKTSISQKSRALLDITLQAKPDREALYRLAIAEMRKTLEKAGADKPGVVVEAVITTLTATRPKPRVLVGRGAKQLAGLHWLPTGIRDSMLMSSLGVGKALKQVSQSMGQPVPVSIVRSL